MNTRQALKGAVTGTHNECTSRYGAIDLYGHGRVGQALTVLLEEKNAHFRSITTSKGLIEGDNREPPFAVIDCTSPYYTGDRGEAWVQKIEQWLEQGVHLVTCNKAPLATHGLRLTQAADRGGARILSSATVGGGTPVLPAIERLDRTLGVARIEACASGTLGYVLDQVAKGIDVDKAIKKAQRLGYAEPDPRLDLDGTDLTAKAILLQNALGKGGTRTLDLDHAPYITIDPRQVREIAEQGSIPRVVATIAPNRIEMTIQDVPWAAGPPGDAVVQIETHDGDRFLLRGPGAGPRVTAANVLADLEVLTSGLGA